ncbi:MAG: GIY-YIG nuclease family protein [Bacteroidetes bacterium]|nr:GIY-YIG nuclease family protein [Bacteroidota bacterium]
MKLTNAFVYIMSNKRASTFYVGVINDLESRLRQHKNNESEFTSRYNLHSLVYFEIISDIETVIRREKQLKNWKRDWKIKLIQGDNPDFKDLVADWE